MRSAERMAEVPETGREGAGPLDGASLRGDFPILGGTMHGKPLVFLDSGASSQRPRAVLRAVEELYTEYYANVHRGVYQLSQRSTDAYEAAREKVRAFLNAPEARHCLFTRGTTEAINLVARSWGGQHLGPGDVVLVTQMEHHSNLVPWQMIAAERGARVVPVPIRDDGSLDMEAFEGQLGPAVKLVAVAHVSNVLGTVNPVARISELAHRSGALVLVDGAQAVPHLAVDVGALGCDFYAFSGHKMFGPSGIGVLWGRGDLLEAMPPYQGGGGMIARVSFEGTTFLGCPERFEAGTPHIAGAVGLGAAIDYLGEVGMDRVAAWEHTLLELATSRLKQIPGLRILGEAPGKASVLSFELEGIHAHDVATILDQSGVAVRAGHHCAQPLLERLGVTATCRASFALYNTREDVEALVAGVEKAREFLA